MDREAGEKTELPANPTCADCGNQINVHGRYVVDYEIIILEKRAEDDAG